MIRTKYEARRNVSAKLFTELFPKVEELRGVDPRSLRELIRVAYVTGYNDGYTRRVCEEGEDSE